MSDYDAVPSRVDAAARTDQAAEAHNLRLIRKDPILQRILTRYRCMDQGEREQLLRLMNELK